jgi:hypothetical protein
MISFSLLYCVNHLQRELGSVSKRARIRKSLDISGSFWAINFKKEKGIIARETSPLKTLFLLSLKNSISALRSQRHEGGRKNSSMPKETVHGGGLGISPA